MLKILFKSPTALFYAIVVHAVLIGILVFSMDWSSLKENKPRVNIVDAVAVDEKQILKQIEDLKKKERQKKKKEDRHQKKLKDAAAKAKKARKKEEQELAKLIKKRRKQDEQHKAEKKRLAETKKKRLAEQKRKKKIVKNRKLAEQKLAKVREENQRIEEQAAKRRIERLERELKEENDRRRAEEMTAEADERKKQMDAESNQLSEQSQKQIQSVKDKYYLLIQNKVRRSWRKPASAKSGMKSTVSVRLIPGGDVILVATIKSSGDALFDRSVETAVYRAVPLPLPEDPDLFEYFREINFVFNPGKK